MTPESVRAMRLSEYQAFWDHMIAVLKAQGEVTGGR